MTTYLPSPGVAVAPFARPLQTVRIAAFDCEGLGSLSREVGFPVAVVAAVDDVPRHAKGLCDTWYASGTPKGWDDWMMPFDFDNWLFRDWRIIRFDQRWFGRSRHPLATCVDDGTIALDLPAGVDRGTFASAFRDGLADLRFEAITRRPAFVVKWHYARRGSVPASRYAYASASDRTPTEVRDLVRLTPRDLPAIADVALSTLERLDGKSRGVVPAARSL